MSLSGTFDIETGTSGNLNPIMTGSPLRWGFIQKVYAILTIQLLFMVAVGGLVVEFHPFEMCLMTTIGGLACYWLLLIIPFFTLATGLACFFTHGKVILEAAILTTVVVVSLTLFIFWGAKRGHDFNFLGPFLFAALNMLIVFGLIQLCTYDDYILAAIALYLDDLNRFLAWLTIFRDGDTYDVYDGC
uniref:BI1-like protein n=1 Tax=Tanacetum cinerariifolium TaxID=118510 RepID=A0A699H824_TANCI|nr:hypothetical protein [Tanacetum cinerariifolium]